MKISVQSRAPRYKGKVPVELESGKGITRDFNGAGIFFEPDKSFSLGQPVLFTIVLEHIDPVGPVRVTCRGKIVRVEENGQKTGVAATINSYSFATFQRTVKNL
jgi:hypothetical protein